MAFARFIAAPYWNLQRSGNAGPRNVPENLAFVVVAMKNEAHLCLPTEIVSKVCDYSEPLNLERMAQTCQTWCRGAWSCGFWAVLDAQRFGMHLAMPCPLFTPRDVAWKLSRDLDDLTVSQRPRLRKWSEAAARIRRLAATGRLALVRDVDFSFFFPNGLGEEALMRLLFEAARGLERVRISSSEGTVIKWVTLQLECLRRYHPNPESLGVFCFSARFWDPRTTGTSST